MLACPFLLRDLKGFLCVFFLCFCVSFRFVCFAFTVGSV